MMMKSNWGRDRVKLGRNWLKSSISIVSWDFL